MTHTPVATATVSRTPTQSAAPSPTTTRTPVNSPTPSVTPVQGRLTWLFNGRKRINNIGSPLAGFTFAFPRQGKKPSLDLEDSASRFCTQPGLAPRVRLDLDPPDCENECTIGVFPQDSTSVIHIAHLPALHRAAGTFDVLIDTVLGCEGGQPPTQLRMPAAVTYVKCIGDCNGDDAVSIDELVLAVRIALGENETSDCLVADRDGSGTVEIDELIAAVSVALSGCGAEGCPIEAGTYTLTQTSGGMVQVGTLAIPFPAGGTMVLDVQPASSPDCFHDTVVPFPGGFTSPAYCIPGTGYTARLIQRACGVGRVASRGGGDYTISELGDSSSQAECNNQQQCVPGIDDKIRLDVAVGDGTPDQCTPGQANVVLTVPVETLVWIDQTMPMTCPAADGEYNPETDQLLSRIEQIFDFTTDTNTVDWADLSGDGCTIAHTDPPIRFSSSGTCWDIAGQTVTIAASGALGSASAPLYDTSFTALFPSTVSAPAPPSGASCDAPPPIDFAGKTVRCLE